MRRQKQEPFLQLYGILQQYDHATATRRKPWARLFHGFWETAMSSSTMYDNVVLCRLQSKSSLGSMSRIETPSEDSKGRPYPNRFRISQSARGDPEGGCRSAGRLVLAASLIGPNNGTLNGSDCRRNTKSGPSRGLASYFPGSEMKTRSTSTQLRPVCRSE